MRLEQIEYFLHVAEKQSITGAARELFISQPALSKQIALLEKEVGVPLFERQTRGVTLTRAGAQFEKDLKNILKELENARKNAVLAGKIKKQLLNVGCFDGIYIDDFLPRFFQYFRHAAPELKLILHRMSFSEGAEALKKGKADIWLTLEPEWNHAEGFCEKVMLRRKSAFIFSSRSSWGQKDKTEIRDFQGGTLVTVDREKSPGFYRTAMDKLQDMGIFPGDIEETDSISTVLSYLKLVDGFTILSDEAVSISNDLRKVNLPDHMDVCVLAVWNRGSRDITAWMEEYDPEESE